VNLMSIDNAASRKGAIGSSEEFFHLENQI
jgi:hypothetical protein